MRPLPLLLFACGFLAACQTLPVPAEVATEVATEAATKAASAVPSLAATATNTPTPFPTVRSTATAIPSATATSTPITPPPVTVKAPSLDTTISLISPDGEWEAIGNVVLVANDQLHHRFWVQSLVGPAAWEEQVVDELGPTGLGYTIPSPVQWSKDSAVVYWSNRPVPDGCAGPVNAGDLHRLDVSTGESVQLLDNVSFWAAVAPNERAVAYRKGANLVILDLATRTEQLLPFTPEVGSITTIVWAPDSQSFVFGVAPGGCRGLPEPTLLYRVEAATLAITPLPNEGAHIFTPVEWPTMDALVLEEIGIEKQRWQLNPATLALTEAPTAPEPRTLLQSFSPDGQWLAQGALYRANPTALSQQRLTIKRIDGTATWTPFDQPLPIGCCAIIPGVVAWAANGEAVYWGEQMYPDGCGYYIGPLNLHRLNLVTGEDTVLIPEISLRAAVAPDESAVVYSTAQGLVLRNLASGAEQTVPWQRQENDFLTGIVWAADSQSFVVGSLLNACSSSSAYLHRFKASDLSAQTLLNGDARGFVPLHWPAPNTLFLRDNAGERWQLNPDTGDLGPAPTR